MGRLKAAQRWLALVLSLFWVPVASPQSQSEPSNVAMNQAMRQGDLDTARRILRSGAQTNVWDTYGMTPLVQAIRTGYMDFAEELLAAGADPKFTGPVGDSALMSTAFQGNLGLAKELLDRHVPVNVADIQGETALMAASQTGLDGKMVQLLLDAGADPNTKSLDNFTALMNAAAEGNWVATGKLLRAGADPTVKDKYGQTAQDKACDRGEKGHAHACDLLREALKNRQSSRQGSE
ncbi:MAG: hypothetical protein DMG79_16290 [Acidobacteria bacterium]|nr:MAG: hypothetical protein DMG79_16290 [Acidobacteriota bacterium]